MRPGVLDCGCLWDGEHLHREADRCDLGDHGLPPGSVVLLHGTIRDAPPRDEWPDPKGRWIWGDSGEHG